MKLIKVRRGGERFWARVIKEDETGITAVCDNDTIDPQAPRYGETFHVEPDEMIYDEIRHYPKPNLSLV